MGVSTTHAATVCPITSGCACARTPSESSATPAHAGCRRISANHNNLVILWADVSLQSRGQAGARLRPLRLYKCSVYSCQVNWIGSRLTESKTTRDAGADKRQERKGGGKKKGAKVQQQTEKRRDKQDFVEGE